MICFVSNTFVLQDGFLKSGMLLSLNKLGILLPPLLAAYYVDLQEINFASMFFISTIKKTNVLFIPIGKFSFTWPSNNGGQSAGLQSGNTECALVMQAFCFFAGKI